MRKKYSNDSEFTSLSDEELEAEKKKCDIMYNVSGTAVGRKAFAKRGLRLRKEQERRAEEKSLSKKKGE